MSDERRGFWQELTSVHWDGLDWVEELLYLCMATMEAGLIFLWYLFFNALTGSAQPALPFWAVCVLLWSAYLLASLLNRTALTADRRQALVAGLMILMVLVTVRLGVYGSYGIGNLGWLAELADRLFNALTALPPDLMVVIAVLIVWWRGIILSRKDYYDTHKVGLHFRIGIIVLFGYFLFSILGPRENVVLIVLAYFFFGLISVALARMLEVGGIHDSSLGSKQWVAVLAGSSLGSLGLALLISLVFSRQILLALFERFRPALRFLLNIAYYVIGALLYLFFPLVSWLMDVFRAFQRGRGGLLSDVFLSPLQNPLGETPIEETQRWMPYASTVIMIIVLIGGLLLVARLIRQLMAAREKEDDIERESVWSMQDFANDLKNSLLQGLANLRAFVEQFSDRKKRSAASIRKIYASMVDLAAEAGYGRRPAVTPYEHRHTLYQAFPGGDEAVNAITEAYIRVHYGQAPDSREEMQQIADYWAQVQRLASPKVEGET